MDIYAFGLIMCGSPSVELSFPSKTFASEGASIEVLHERWEGAILSNGQRPRAGSLGQVEMSRAIQVLKEYQKGNEPRLRHFMTFAHGARPSQQECHSQLRPIMTEAWAAPRPKS